MDHFSKQLLNTDETGPEEHTREEVDEGGRRWMRVRGGG